LLIIRDFDPANRKCMRGRFDLAQCAALYGPQGGDARRWDKKSKCFASSGVISGIPANRFQNHVRFSGSTYWPGIDCIPPEPRFLGPNPCFRDSSVAWRIVSERGSSRSSSQSAYTRRPAASLGSA
jgi:hypothetical protein